MIRRIALTFFLACIAASAIIVGVVHAQPTPSTPAPPPLTGPTGPPLTGRPPLPTPIGLECLKNDLAAILDPYCEATLALITFIGRLAPTSTSISSPNCDSDMISRIADMNLKVNTAIDMHKYSDRILDRLRRISHKDKSAYSTRSDINIRYIIDILTRYFSRDGKYNSGSSPIIHHRELVVLASEVLDLGYKLSDWGVDAGFLTAARGYSIYQFVLNCIRRHDANPMGARAYSVRIAAESESYFAVVGERFRGVGPRPALHRLEVERLMIDGVPGTGYGGGFPKKIYLGSNHYFRADYFSGVPDIRQCPDGEIRNFYGEIEGRFDDVPAFKPKGPIIFECAGVINAKRYESINALLTQRLLLLGPDGSKSRVDYGLMLDNIVNGINSHIARIKREKDREDCDLKADPKCEKLITGTAEERRDQRLDRADELDDVAQRERRHAEFVALRTFSATIRNSLSPEIFCKDGICRE
jgi:hypothetical protein